MNKVYIVYRYESDCDSDVFCVCATEKLAQRYVESLRKDGWQSACYEKWRVDTKYEYSQINDEQ